MKRFSATHQALVLSFSLLLLSCGGCSPVSSYSSGSGSTAGSAEPTPVPLSPVALAEAKNLAIVASTVTQAFIVATYNTFSELESTMGLRTVGPQADLAPAPALSPSPTTIKYWSDASTWASGIPATNAMVEIPIGTTVILNTDTPSLGAITVNGTLKFADQNVSITATNITVSNTGAIQIGTPGAPFASKATITLTGIPSAFPSSGNRIIQNTRGITVMGGKLEIYGASPMPVWTQLNDHAEAGATSFTLKESVIWKAGSTIAVGPSDYYGVNPTERMTLASAQVASGSSLVTNEALSKFRWGKMQYMTDTGLSLIPGTYTPHVTPAPTTLDQRAAVGNLSRNIVIQGALDDAWRDHGFGAHVMIMGNTSKVFVDGVEFRRVGQAGAMGRYPFHWHMLSYNPDNGLWLGDATGHEIRNSSIWQSSQRCIVLHATNGVRVSNNICHDIKGHAFFLEDGVERKNVFNGNLVLMIRAPKAADLMAEHEGLVVDGAGSSGFWITNPDNTIRNNVVGDSIGSAYWNSFPTTGVGASRLVVNHDLIGTDWALLQMNPRNMPHGVFDNNVGYSTNRAGINTDMMLQGGGAVGNDLGQTGPSKYLPTFKGRPYNINGLYIPGNEAATCAGEPRPAGCITTTLRALYSRVTLYKNDNGYVNRIGAPDYPEWVMSDITGTYASGAGDDGAFMRGLFIGKSLNNLTAYPSGARPQAMFATYHSTFSMRNNTMAHIAYQEETDPERTNSGVFKTDDYYTDGLQRGTVLNANNRFIDAFAGALHYPANLYSQMPANPTRAENFSLAGALWDAHGYWGPRGTYWTFDVPFLTSGGNCQPSLFPTPSGKNSAGKYNGQSCTGEFYGVWRQPEFDFLKVVNDKGMSNGSMWPVDIERLDCSASSFNSASIGPASRACRWIVGSGYDSWKLGIMRGAALRNGGRYKMMFPTPEDRIGTAGGLGGPVFSAGTITGTMVNAEGATIPISIPKEVNLEFTNMSRASDSFVMAVSFDGTKTPVAVIGRTGNAFRWRALLPPNIDTSRVGAQEYQYLRVLTMAATLAEMESDPSGTKMWQDRDKNLVWFKVVGSLPLHSWYRIGSFTAPFGQNLYQGMSLYMRDNTIANVY